MSEDSLFDPRIVPYVLELLELLKQSSPYFTLKIKRTSSSCSLTRLGALLADPEQSLREAWTLNSRILEELLSLASNATKLKKLQSQTEHRSYVSSLWPLTSVPRILETLSWPR